MKSLGSGPITGDNAQTLTSAQKAQARSNIGVVSLGNAKFTGTLAIPGTLLGGSSNAVLAVSPAVAGDVLATTDVVVLQALGVLPTGMNIAYWVVSAANQITVYFTSNALITAGANVNFAAVAQR